MKILWQSVLAGTLVCGAVQAERPNVVLIYGDDVGFGDVGAYGATLIPTPNIDRLAAEGIRFTDGHSEAGTCTPSRFSMLTGRYAFRDGVNILPPNSPLCISESTWTLPKLFQQAGYETALIGKWHLGLGTTDSENNWNEAIQPGPLEVGFDRAYFIPSTNDRVPCVFMEGHRVHNLDPNDPIHVGKTFESVQVAGSTIYPDASVSPEAMTYYKTFRWHDDSVINGLGRIGYMSGGKAALWDDESISDRLVEKAKSYIAAPKEKPFFLYFASQDIHVPRTPHPRFQGTTTLGYRGDAMVQFDWTVGQIMAALKKQGISDNTIVIFSSDNGSTYNDGYYDGCTVESSNEEVDRGHDASGIWRGGKGQIFEGANRVPFIVRWPAQIEPGVSDAMVNQIDCIASFASFLGQPIPAGAALDSRNTWDTWTGKRSAGLTYMLTETRFRTGLRKNQWKYIAAGRARKGKGAPAGAQLYDLATDPSEQVNVIAAHPELAQEMDAAVVKIKRADGIRTLFE